ncbi:MAG TPA: hypothetical protein VK585_04620 [Jiangellaceae bacterium]|nr:hypothetical protein [Jiangellaceae bacterium]
MRGLGESQSCHTGGYEERSAAAGGRGRDAEGGGSEPEGQVEDHVTVPITEPRSVPAAALFAVQHGLLPL